MNVFKTSIVLAAAAVFVGAASPVQALMAEATRIPGTFTSPIYVTSAPNTPNLLFVVEQIGTIQVLENEVKRPQPFLNIEALVSAGGERGLLSIAFAPDYATSRRFYVAFTNQTGDLEINEFRSPNSPYRATPSTRRRLLTIRHREADNHNGGQLAFGPDGLLYISTGDGGEVFPRGKYSRDLNSLLGKILRIDPTPDRDRPYTIPADNPRFDTSRQRDEIFAYGLRNPWRFSFDGNRIAIADVGQSAQEEINFLTIAAARGANFGWPAYEGNAAFVQTNPPPPGPDEPTFPMHTYLQADGGCAVIGGYVSRDPNVPALSRRYVYGDLCTGEVRSFVPDVVGQEARGDRLVLRRANGLTSFGVGPDRRMYFTQSSGELKRIDPLPAD